MKNKIVSIVTKVVVGALALTLSLGVPVNVAHAAHSSGGGSRGDISSYVLHDYNSFMITQYAHRCSKDVRVEGRYGTIDYYQFVFITYNGSTLEIYDWNSGKRIAVVEDAVLTRTRYE